MIRPVHRLLLLRLVGFGFPSSSAPSVDLAAVAAAAAAVAAVAAGRRRQDDALSVVARDELRVSTVAFAFGFAFAFGVCLAFGFGFVLGVALAGLGLSLGVGVAFLFLRAAPLGRRRGEPVTTSLESISSSIDIGEPILNRTS